MPGDRMRFSSVRFYAMAEKLVEVVRDNTPDQLSVGIVNSVAANITAFVNDTLIPEAVAAERERCAKVVEAYDGNTQYITDADGNEFPEATYDMAALARRIREGT